MNQTEWTKLIDEHIAVPCPDSLVSVRDAMRTKYTTNSLVPLGDAAAQKFYQNNIDNIEWSLLRAEHSEDGVAHVARTWDAIAHILDTQT